MVVLRGQFRICGIYIGRRIYGDIRDQGCGGDRYSICVTTGTWGYRNMVLWEYGSIDGSTTWLRYVRIEGEMGTQDHGYMGSWEGSDMG